MVALYFVELMVFDECLQVDEIFINSLITLYSCAMYPYRYDGKPEEVLNPKKKQLEKIFPVSIP